LDTRAKNYLRAREEDGWYEPEVLTRSGRCWRWTRGDAKIRFENPRAASQTIALKLSVRALLPRDLQIWYNGAKLQTADVGAELREVNIPRVTVVPGESVLELRSSQAPVSPGPQDQRKLGFAVYDFEIEFSDTEDGTVSTTARL
jgi:hypothetical protein